MRGRLDSGCEDASRRSASRLIILPARNHAGMRRGGMYMRRVYIMRCTWVLLILFLWAPMAATAQKAKKAPAKPPAQTITGCVDEKSSDFVLRSDAMLREIAALEAVRF